MGTELVGKLNILTQIQGGELRTGSQVQGGVISIPFVTDGVGIETIIFNADYSITFILTNGVSYTSPPLIGPGVSPGGTTGQILAKATDDDYDTEWVDPGMQDIPVATTETLGGIVVGSDLLITNNGVLSVDKANAVQEDNTKPITAAAVYTEVGNINAALATI